MKKANQSPVSPLDAHLGFWMRFVSNSVSARFESLLADKGVSVSEWVALRAMYDTGGGSHGALMAALGMTKGAVSKVVTRLQEKRLVERIADAADARAQRLALTPAAQALVPELAALADQNDAHFFGHLDAGQRAALMAVLQDMVQVHQLKSVPLS